MAKTTFVYVIYIRATPERLWEALTEPEFTRKYWFGMHLESEWTPGSPWKMVADDGKVTDAGEILEADPPRHLVIKWRNEWKPEFKAEGYSRCTMDLEPVGDAVKLSITHELDREHARFIEQGVSGGWPKVLSNLKSLLETGKVVMDEKI